MPEHRAIGYLVPEPFGCTRSSLTGASATTRVTRRSLRLTRLTAAIARLRLASILLDAFSTFCAEPCNCPLPSMLPPMPMSPRL